MQERTLLTFSGKTLSGDRKIRQIRDYEMTPGGALQAQNCFVSGLRDYYIPYLQTYTRVHACE